jgi:hypothetical protein
MVKGTTDRVNKYNAKIDPDAVRIRFNLQGANMKASQAPMQQAIYDVQDWVRTQLNASTSPNAISPLFSAPYQALGMRCLGLKNKFKGEALNNEVALAGTLWKARGANSAMVDLIVAHFTTV